MTQPVNILLTA